METELVLAGCPTTGGGEAFAVDNPATGGHLADVAAASPEQVAEAVAAAATAGERWAAASQPERTAALRRIAARLAAERERLAHLATLETGRPYASNLGYVDWTAEIFGFYAELARGDGGRVAPANAPGQLSLVQRVPLGVVAALTPFNYPLALLAQKVAPALAAGNTVVVKPSPLTTLVTLAVGRLLAEELPAGVLSVLAGDADVGTALIEHPATAMVAFTGSTEVGRRIGERCGALGIRAHLELGGKDPAVVLPDADPRSAARAVAWAAFLNAGQVCTSTERVYVHRDVLDDFLHEGRRIAAGVVVGDPFEEATRIGPLRTGAARDRVRSLLESVGARGATVHGGSVPDRPGYFLRPAVVTDVPEGDPLLTEETFGPVLPVVGVKDAHEAIDLAAASTYGLGASLYTHDARVVALAADRLRVGTLWVNDPVLENLGAPFGGVRASGDARELGLEGLHAFTTTRHLSWTLELADRSWWFDPPTGPDAPEGADA